MVATYAIIEYLFGEHDRLGEESDSEDPVADEERGAEQGEIFSEEPRLLEVLGLRFLVNEPEMEETKKCGPDPPPQNCEESPPCPETPHDSQTLAVRVGAASGIVSVLVSGSNRLGLGVGTDLFLEPDTVNHNFIHLVLWFPGRGFAHTMGPIHGAAIRDGRRRKGGPVPKPFRETVPIHPEPTLAELCLFAHPTVDTILFCDGWRRKPLIVCAGQLRLRAVVLVGAFDGLPKGGRGIGDGGVRTFVEG